MQLLKCNASQLLNEQTKRAGVLFTIDRMIVPLLDLICMHSSELRSLSLVQSAKVTVQVVHHYSSYKHYSNFRK